VKKMMEAVSSMSPLPVFNYEPTRRCEASLRCDHARDRNMKTIVYMMLLGTGSVNDLMKSSVVAHWEWKIGILSGLDKLSRRLKLIWSYLGQHLRHMPPIPGARPGLKNKRKLRDLGGDP